MLSTWKNSGYLSISGTSMATPHVSGAAALVKAQNPGISAVQLRCLLDLSADDLAPPARDHQTAWSRVSPVKALALDQLLKQQGLYGTFEQACVAGAKLITEASVIRRSERRRHASPTDRRAGTRRGSLNTSRRGVAPPP